MDDALVELVAANLAFVGTHFALSHPLRAPLVRVLGDRGFQVVYSLVAFAALGWVYVAFKSAPTADLGGSGDMGWIIATVIMLPAMVLFAGSLIGNPALPTPDASDRARQEPAGVFIVTRHPLMWSFALWALSHIILMWSWRTMITALAMGFLALVGAHLQDGKKQQAMGDAWEEWQSKTSFWPRFGRIFGVGPLWWMLGLILWLIFSWAHLQIGGIPAGVWLWF
ncbi:MAG TPA: MFS transporter [Erythrobacter sp.]|nr:MFS transporter [Erythrobacter sp.]